MYIATSYVAAADAVALYVVSVDVYAVAALLGTAHMIQRGWTRSPYSHLDYSHNLLTVINFPSPEISFHKSGMISSVTAIKYRL